jgi:hypothetical protein
MRLGYPVSRAAGEDAGRASAGKAQRHDVLSLRGHGDENDVLVHIRAGNVAQSNYFRPKKVNPLLCFSFWALQFQSPQMKLLFYVRTFFFR